MPTRSPLLSFLFAFAAALLPAQDWRTEKVADVGVAFDAPSRLERLPMKIGDEMLYQRARLRPKDDADYVRAQYYWTCDVLEFRKTPPKDDEIQVPEGLPEALKERFKEMMRSRRSDAKTSFKQWLTERTEAPQQAFEVQGKAKKGRSGKLDYAHWVWTEKDGYGPVGVSYCEAAVYTFPDREVALLIYRRTSPASRRASGRRSSIA
jgi:hypothetical protein